MFYSLFPASLLCVLIQNHVIAVAEYSIHGIEHKKIFDYLVFSMGARKLTKPHNIYKLKMLNSNSPLFLETFLMLLQNTGPSYEYTVTFR